MLSAGLNSAYSLPVLCHSEEETVAFGRQLAAMLKPGDVLCFFGDLGAGKTTLIKGIASKIAGIDPCEVNSPTFVYLNIYQGEGIVYHFDLYRLRNEEEFLSMGFDEMFFAGGVCCIEWSERIARLLPKNTIRVEMLHCGGDCRQITVVGKDNKDLKDIKDAKKT